MEFGLASGLGAALQEPLTAALRTITRPRTPLSFSSWLKPQWLQGRGCQVSHCLHAKLSLNPCKQYRPVTVFSTSQPLDFRIGCFASAASIQGPVLGISANRQFQFSLVYQASEWSPPRHRLLAKSSSLELVEEEEDENEEEEENEPRREPITLPRITEDMVSLQFARSGGAGGQNVNKVNTKVDMRFSVLEADWLPDWVKEKLLETQSGRINNDGELIVTSTRTRTQRGNINDALEKLQKILDDASYVPPPPSEEKKKRMKKLKRIANERRLDTKKKHANKKSERRNKNWD